MDHHHNRAAAPGQAAPENVRVDPVGLAPLGPTAAGPAGLSAPRCADAHRLAGASGIEDKTETNTKIVASRAADRKAFETLRAQFARTGIALYALDGGTLMATRWNCCKRLPDLYAATRFLHQIGGA
jgi:hypothetical protein